MALPVGVPLPVVNTMAVQPPATMEVTEEMSYPAVSMITAPFLVGRAACSITSTTGLVPPLRMQPRLFSSMVESPPALLPGVGWPARQFCPAPARCSSYSWQMRIIWLWISGVAPRRASSFRRPVFLAERPLSPTERGTALHQAMQFLDLFPKYSNRLRHSIHPTNLLFQNTMYIFHYFQ